MNIYLIGYRGTGKSSVAPLVAKLLGPDWRHVDMDPLIEEEAEATIAEIFADEGEAGFRDRESNVLSSLAAKDRQVVATGGGVIERPDNHSLLKDGFVVWLTAPKEVLLDRIAGDQTTAARRPNLTAQGGIEEIDRMLTRRTPIYRSLAKLSLSTESMSPEELAQQIVRAFTTDREGRS